MPPRCCETRAKGLLAISPFVQDCFLLLALRSEGDLDMNVRSIVNFGRINTHPYASSRREALWRFARDASVTLHDVVPRKMISPISSTDGTRSSSIGQHPDLHVRNGLPPNAAMCFVCQ